MISVKENCIKVASMNVGTASFGRGIAAAELQIKDMIERADADVVMLYEVDTRYFKKYETFNIDGYLQFPSRPTSVGDKNIKKTRTLGLVRAEAVIDATQLYQDGAARAEVWLKLTLRNMSTVILAGCYMEWVNHKSCRDVEGFHRMIAKNEKDSLLILGDFNKCLERARDPQGSNPEDAKFVEDIEHMGLKILDAGYTFCRTINGKVTMSKLDWGITNMENIKLRRTWQTYSDHAMTWLHMDGRAVAADKYKETQDRRGLYTDDSIDGLKQKVTNNWDDLISGNLDQRAEKLGKLIMEHKTEMAPTKMRKAMEKPKPEQSRKLKSIRRAINRARTREQYASMAKLKRKYRQALAEHKRKDVERILNDGPESLWKLYRKYTGEPRSQPRILEDGKVLTDQEAAEKMLKFFHAKVTNLRNQANPDGRMPNYDGARTRNTFSLREVTEQEVQNIIKNMKSTDSKDHTGISQTDMKKLRGPLIAPLTKLINDSLREGKFPEPWKKARIAPALKSGKPAGEVSSYRPLSMLVPMSKVLEQVVKIQLQAYATAENFIPQSQHGYQPGRSIETAVTQALSIVDQKKRKNKKCAIVCFDFSAAFDLIDKDLLMKKLDRLGCDETSKRWIASYLKDRSIFVEINGKRSRTKHINFGSPQGSCLSPLLFLLLVHDMEHNLPGKLVSYADDSTNIVWGNTKEEVKNKIRESVTSMINYASMCGLALNVDKTEIMYLGEKPLGELRIEGKPVKETKSIKFLGIHISKTQQMRTHIDVAASELHVKLGVMRRLQKIMPKDSRIKVAKAIILGKIRSFMNTVLDPVYKKGDSQINRVQRIWNAAARIALGIHPRSRTPTEELMRGMGTDSIRKIATLSALKLAYEIMRNDGSKHYLATLGDEEKRAERARRLRYENNSLEWSEGRSCTIKSRALWNVLENSGLRNLKACGTIEDFITQCRVHYQTIENEIKKRWIWE